MEQVSAAVLERARKIEGVILQKMLVVGQITVANSTGLHESKVSKLKGDGVLSDLSKVLAALGLKVVSADKQCFSVEEVNALLFFAKERMKSLQSASSLSFEEDY